MQDSNNRKYGLFGITTLLSDNLTLHTAISTQKNLIASYATLNGKWDFDNLFMTWKDEPKEYRGIPSATRDAYIDYIHQVNDKLSIGFNGRHHKKISDDEISFLLPTLRYLPFSSLSLSLIPNYDGYYRFSSTYTPNSKFRATYTLEKDEHRISLVNNINDDWNTYLDGSTNLHDKNHSR